MGPTHYAEDIGAAFRALAANPEDVGLQLALTDWVQEHAPYMMPLVEHIRQGRAQFGTRPGLLSNMGRFGPFQMAGTQRAADPETGRSVSADMFFQPVVPGGDGRRGHLGLAVS